MRCAMPRLRWAGDTGAMARARRIGGAVKVRDARRLFEETGDYKYVALAIGAAVNDPPKWALIECWRLKKITQSDPAMATNLPAASRIMDRAIELMIEHEDQQRNTPTNENCSIQRMPSSGFNVRPLPKETALKRALAEIAPDREEQAAIEALKKAWQREEQEELVNWETDRREPNGVSIEGYRTTYRIERVIYRVEAKKLNERDPNGPWVEDPDDLIFWGRLIGQL